MLKFLLRWKQQALVESKTNPRKNVYVVDELDDAHPRSPIFLEHPNTRLGRAANGIDDIKYKWEDYFKVRIEEAWSIKADCFKNMVNDQMVKDVMNDVKALKIKWIKLEQITIDLSNCKEITDDAVTIIANSLHQNFTDIKRLALCFSGCSNITDEGVKTLCNVLKMNMKNYEYLALDFGWGTKITDKGIACLNLVICQKESNLRELHLVFDRCNFSDRGARHIAKNITRLLKIEKLTLSLRWCNNITDKGIMYLSSSIASKHKKLTSLVLNFYNCQNVTSQSVKYLGDKLSKNCQEIERMILNFDRCVQITDEGLQYLALKLSHKNKLQELDLSFSSCTKITNTGIKNMVNNMDASLMTLKKLNLNFENCFKLTEEAFVQLSNKIIQKRSIYLVQELNLNLYFCPQITPDMKSNLKTLFQSIPTVSVK